MKRFIVYDKLSKKRQRELNNEKRGTWGNINPVTKVKPSGKIYSRKKYQNIRKAYAS